MTGITRKLCQTDQKYNLIFLISGAFHTKSVSNGPRRSWLCDFRRPAWHEICVSVKLTKITIWSFWFQVHFTRNLCQMARKGQDLCNFRWPASHEICVSVKLTKIEINFDFLISGALHTKSVSNGPRILCQCQTDQNYNLILLISAAIHTKSVSNGPRRSWLLWFETTGITRKLCQCQTDQNYHLIVLISGACHTKSVSNGARRSWLLWLQTTGITQKLCQCQTDQNYHLIVLISGACHTKSVSNGARTSWFIDFQVSGITRNHCQMALRDPDFCDFRWPASHEICVSVKLTKIEINFDFLISGALHTKSVSNGPRILCQCQTDQNYNLILLISAAIHTKSVSNGPRRSWLLWLQTTCITQKLCQCQTDQNYNLIVLISGACHTKSVSNGARTSWFSGERHHTKSLSNGPKRSLLLWFQRTGITRNLCQCQIDQNYNLSFLISGSLHTKSV